MHKLFKNISTALIITMVMTLVPVKIFAEAVSDGSAKSTSADEKKPDGKIVAEVKERRERNVKTFLLDDGSFEADIYKEPIHYYENGEWKDIDNSLQEDEDSTINEVDNGETNENTLPDTNVKDFNSKTNASEEKTVILKAKTMLKITQIMKLIIKLIVTILVKR